MAKQHSSQVYKILTMIDPQKQMSFLFKKSLTCDTFLQGHTEKKYKPDTAKSYLCSLTHFCSFVLTEELQGVKVDCDCICKVEYKTFIALRIIALLLSRGESKDGRRRYRWNFG